MISVVLTHYNKQQQLLDCVSCLKQDAQYLSTIIVVDDHSDPETWQATKQQLSRQHPDVMIVDNDHNCGPATRVNQGLQLVTTPYVYMIDSDDYIAPNTLSCFYQLAQSYQVDVIYGRLDKVADLSERQPLSKDLEKESNHVRIMNHPLTDFLHRPMIHLSLLARTETLLQAGGCHPYLFIQDESLALNLHAAARRTMQVTQPSAYRLTNPLDPNQRLSVDKSLQHHDTFLTYADFFDAYGHELTASQAEMICQRVFSQFYKAKKAEGHRQHLMTLPLYLASKAGATALYPKYQARMRAYFAALPVKRPDAQCAIVI